MNFIGIIPARFASTRFPGKPLALLGGKTVIQRVYEKVADCLDAAYVATDDSRIFDHVKSWGGNVVMTSTKHKSGTDRIEEAIEIIGGEHDVIINIQGDEPFIHKSQIEEVCRCFEDSDTQIATLGIPFKSDIEVISNPNSPKIVIDNRHFAMYFSRSVIPFIREITSLPQSSLEIAESLEQLRWLQNGYKIKVGITDIETIGIDTPEDLAAAEKMLS